MSSSNDFNQGKSTPRINDCLHRFIIENTRIRGEVVQLHDSWIEILKIHDYPKQIQELLGQALAATALLGTTLKYSSSLTLQIQSDGPIHLLVTEFTSENSFRGMADWKGEILDTDFNKLCKNGRLAITIDPKNGNERYQSIVEIKEPNFADTLRSYFQNSEQINTQLWLSSNENKVAGLLLQEMPSSSNSETSDDQDAWNRISSLATTIKDDELLNLPIEKLLFRLYHQEDVRIFSPQKLHFSCPCSRQRTQDTLYRLGRKEIESILAEQGKILVECHFCRHKYSFDSIDAEQLFSKYSVLDAPENKH